METNFFDRVETSYSNTPPQVYARILKKRVMDLAPGAMPDLRDVRDAGVAFLIWSTSPLVYLTILGKEGIQTVIATTRRRFGKINVAETIDSQAQQFWDTDLPAKADIDPNYFQDGIRTKDKYII